MSAFFRVSTLATVFLSFLIIASNAIADENDYVFTGKVGIAIRAYDPVSYHLDQLPVKGSSEFSTEWKGAVWHFASAENRDLFKADPERWAPRYGGYCAYAVANDALASTDPRAWTVYKDRLYLNYSLRVRKKWTKDILGYIEIADRNWPDVLSK